MKMKFNIVHIACLFIVLSAPAQSMRQLYFDQVKVEVKGTTVNGLVGAYPFAEGKVSGPYQLFQSDSLKISVKYKMVSNSSRRSSVMDSGIKLKIEYYVDYMGMTTTKKSEKMYFLDDRQQFSEKDVFTFQSGRFASSVIRLSYNGRFSE
jgi:hypothetical protein